MLACRGESRLQAPNVPDGHGSGSLAAAASVPPSCASLLFAACRLQSMLALGRFLQQQAQDEAGDQYVDLLERLVQRVSDAVLLPDRREALQQLRDLLLGSPKAQLAFGAVGFPAMLQVVRDRDDGEMVQLALESLAAAVAVGSEARTTQVGIPYRLLVAVQFCPMNY